VAYAPESNVKNNQQLEVTAKVGSIAEAQSLAENRLRLANKYGLTAQFTVPGDPDLMAGLTVLLTGWGMWSGKYIIKQAQHTVGRSGYITQIKLRRVLEG
jgi:phage protein D